MIDIKRIKENPDAIKAGMKAKEVDCDATIDRILELDEQRRQLIASTEQRKAMRRTSLPRKTASSSARRRVQKRRVRIPPLWKPRSTPTWPLP